MAMRQAIRNFDVTEAIAQAWDFLWAANLKLRAENEAAHAKTGHWPYGHSSTYYLTAADLEYQVRAWAHDAAEGKPWRQTRGYPGYSYGVRISDLQGRCRNFLLRNPNITGHNFGRGHISGMRFRPVGQPISPTEQATITANQKARGRPKPLHFESKEGRAMCTGARRNGYYSSHRSTAWLTRLPAQVTCPRCLKLMSKEEATT